MRDTLQKHKDSINTLCRILSTAIAAASLIVATASLKVQIEQKSQPEVPVPTETQ